MTIKLFSVHYCQNLLVFPTALINTSFNTNYRS